MVENTTENNEAENGYSFWAEQANAGTAQDSSYYNTQRTAEAYNQGPQVTSNPSVKRKKTGIGRLFAKAVAAVALGAIAAGTFLGVNEIYYKVNPDSKMYFTTADKLKAYDVAAVTLSNIQSNPMTLTIDDLVPDVVEECMPSIVAISTKSKANSWYGTYDVEGGGSGIIVGENDNELLIATNSHVVSETNEIAVTFINKKQATATIKGNDTNSDLAVVAIKKTDLDEDTLNSIKIARLADTDEVRVGQKVIAIGNALGYGQSVTQGCVSALNREVSIDGEIKILHQTDAAINPGNSGGALINMKGEVIGINSAKYASSSVEGMGFAIPITDAISILEELMSREVLSDEEKGYLGVYLGEIDEATAYYYNWPIGVYVAKLVENGAAQEAGIMVGDIIVGVNGATVKTATQLTEKITSHRYGETVTITLKRQENGTFTEKNIDVVLRQLAN